MLVTVDDLKGAEHIDTRDIIAAAIALRDELADLESLTPDDDDERALLAFDETGESEIEDYPYGATMIRTDCFEDYAQELAEDIGAIGTNTDWPLSCIDWKHAARELAHDYSLVSFLGWDYYVR